VEQRSEEWFAARCGKATASRYKEILSKGAGTTRRNYMAELIVERLTGKPYDKPVNDAMRWGTEQEWLAREQLEIEEVTVIEEVGFLMHPTLATGASPDGVIFGLQPQVVEIKCPHKSGVHMATLLSGKMPPEHTAQVQGQMWITGYSSCLFASFDPRMPDHLKLFTQVVERDDAYIKALESAVTKFLTDTDKAVAKLQEDR
jgi:putative phage-type endonuclease